MNGVLGGLPGAVSTLQSQVSGSGGLQSQVATNGQNITNLQTGKLAADLTTLTAGGAIGGSELFPCTQSGTKACTTGALGAYTLGAGITGLGAAGTLTGSEVNNLVQGGVAVKTPLSAIAGYSLSTAAAALPAAGAITGTESITGLQGGAAVRFSPAQQAGFTLTTGVTGAAAAGSVAGTESVPAVTSAGVQTRLTPAQVAGYAFGATMPALTAATTGTGAEGVPLVQNGAPVLGTVNATIAPNARPTHYNMTPGKLLKWRAALAKATAGVSSARIAWWGDSLFAGLGAGTSGSVNDVGAYMKSLPYWASKLFPSGPAITYEGIFGDHVVGDTGSAGVAGYYGNVTFSGTTDWTRASSTLGGNALLNGTNAANGTITVTPRTAVDTFDFYMINSSDSGSVTVTDSNGTLCTINNNGGIQYKKTTCARTTGGPSTLPITITRSAAGNIYVGGVDPYNSTQPSVRFMNFGASGTTAAAQAATNLAFAPLNALKVYAPDLCVINLGINDARGGATVASYQTNLLAMVTACQVSGDVILVWEHQDNTVTEATRAPYRAAMLAVALASNVPMLDLSERAVSFASATSAGLTYDSVHWTAPGYADEATAMLPLLRP